LIHLIISHPKNASLQRETTTAYVQRETGAVAGLERAVQAATAPSAGQQMLQQGYQGALADGISREEYSTTSDCNGQQIAQKRVERGVLLPDGQGIQIQQAVEQVVISEGELGKRKIQEELDIEDRRLHFEERRVQLETLRIRNDKENIQNEKERSNNRITHVLGNSDAMTALDSDWKQDRRLVLQLKEVLVNGVLYDSSTGTGGSADIVRRIAPPSASASISIGQVALEMGVNIEHGVSVKIGKYLTSLYQEKYGCPPDQHDQVVQGAVRKVNSYTEKDRDLMQTAIRAFQ